MSKRSIFVSLSVMLLIVSSVSCAFCAPMSEDNQLTPQMSLSSDFSVSGDFSNEGTKQEADDDFAIIEPEELYVPQNDSDDIHHEVSTPEPESQDIISYELDSADVISDDNGNNSTTGSQNLHTVIIDEPRSLDAVPAEPESKDTNVEVMRTEHEVYVSKITPEEFMRMCAGADSALVLNAVKNRHADVNAKDYYDVTSLMYAAEKNPDAEVINILISAGADPNAKDKDGKTALMYAAKSNPVSEIITALASGGAKMNTRDVNRMTALMYAARNNNAHVVKALIDAGAEELADKRGWTPLFWAARYTSFPEVIGVLLDAGHDPLVRAHDMATPIDHANKNPRLINTREFLRLEEESR